MRRCVEVRVLVWRWDDQYHMQTPFEMLRGSLGVSMLRLHAWNTLISVEVRR